MPLLEAYRDAVEPRRAVPAPHEFVGHHGERRACRDR